MPRDRNGCDPLRRLSETIAAQAVERDRDGGFPREAFAALAAEGLLSDPPRDIWPLLKLLAAVGRGDLSAGRIFEGHVDARSLIDRFGTPKQRTALRDAILGVWNTDAPDDPLRLRDGVFQGKKAFASGIDGLSHAIVTIELNGGRQMIVVPTAKLHVDRSWWRPLGMRASGSHRADLTGLRVEDDWLLGGPDDYLREPWFTAGAIRFLAVQVGGMHAICDCLAAHLQRSGRAENPYQAHRLATAGVRVETGYLWLRQVAEAWSQAVADPADTALRDYLTAASNGARGAVERAALELLEAAERAIGAPGLIAPHPFERLARDLRTYLRQPNPDGAAASFGAALADARWVPGRDMPRCGKS